MLPKRPIKKTKYSGVHAADENIEVRGRGSGINRLIEGRDYQYVTPLFCRETGDPVGDLLVVEHFQEQWMRVAMFDKHHHTGLPGLGNGVSVGRYAIQNLDMADERQWVGHDNIAVRLKNDGIGKPINGPGVTNSFALQIFNKDDVVGGRTGALR